MRSGIQWRRAELRRRFQEWIPHTLDNWLARCAEQYRDRPFVLTDECTLSYAETQRQATRFADGLAALGVRYGDRVGLLMANHPEFVPLKFAIAAAGAIAVPLNYLYRRDELADVLCRSGCTVLITMDGFRDLDYPAMLDEIAPGWRAGSAPNLPSLRYVVVRSAQKHTGALSIPELDELGAANAGAASSAATPGDPGDLLFTSGTTGSPKGVLVTHDAVLRTAYASALTRAFEDGRRILFALPFYHMFGYEEGLLAATMVGGAVIPQPEFDPVCYFEGIQRHRATDVLCVPTMSVALLEHPRRRDYDLSSLSAVLSGSAPAPIWLWERLRDDLGATEIVTGYGMTECGGAMTLTLPEDELQLHAETVGRPKLAGAAGLPGEDALTVYKTVDPVTGEDLTAHEDGELVSCGPATMLGFWNQPEETRRCLRNGWIHSGDLGRIRADGYLEVTGRSKELYKSGGELVMPREIEELLSGHPAISQIFAIGVPDERWGEAGCVCVVRAPEADLGAEDVIALCKARLARFKVPKHVLFLDAAQLPSTPTGKVQKFRLAKWARQHLAKPTTERWVRT